MTAADRLVRVALPVGVDREFTYRVPDPLPAPEPGTRVLVPFGPRRMTGVVVGPGSLADLPPDEAALRDVESVLDAVPAVTPPLMELARFVAEYYVCPLGEVLRAVHGGGPSSEVVARITDAGRLALAGLARGPRQHEILAALDRGDLVVTASSRRGPLRGADALARLREMESRGWLTLRARVAGDVGPSSVQVWSLAPEAPLAGPVARRGLAEILRGLLAEHPGGLSVAEAARLSGRAESAVRAGLRKLESLGAATRRERIEPRVPQAPRARAGADEAAASRRLGAEQAAALERAKALLDAGSFAVLLLEGVTGSGKTEVYLRALRHAVEAGRTGIYLVPEISITPLLMRLVRERFGARTAIVHSSLSAGERRDERARILAGEVDVVLGARSAVFAPLPRLGLVVVDEEHDASYKQDSQPRYHGRDVAVMRARLESACVILGSATPSLESYRNALEGRYELARLSRRAGGAVPATVELVDMREEWRAERGASPFSRRLRGALAATLAAGKQAMILLNRRGWADFVLCRECGEPERCERCAVTMTVHQRSSSLLCHWCGSRREMPAACRTCGGSFLQDVGHGTEQLEVAIGRLLPGVEIGRLDADVARRKGAAGRVLADFEAGRIRLLLGTQMIAKGHDFPNVTLVGVLQADRSLWLPDFRAAERTFQLLVQVAGRAGRGKDPGLVVVQTFSPDHPAIVCARSQDHPTFHASEAPHREALGYPPYRRLIAVLASSEDAPSARRAAEEAAAALRAEVGALGAILGPAPAPIARIKDRHRFQVFVKGPGRRALNLAVRRAIASVATPGDVRIEVDVDPQSLL